MKIDYLNILEQSNILVNGQLTARELTQQSLDTIARHNSDMHAFLNVMVDEALAQADALDETLARTGTPVGPLHGVPIAVKEELDVAGQRTSFGTNAVSKPATADCEPVRRLRSAGAIIIGKTAMPEFGQWPLTESATNGYTRNPWNRAFSTAGSSGGTAAAVASGMVAAGLGGDGGGSIRLPAAWCGLFGLKPQRGRVSAAPNKALWRGLGTYGALTRTVADAALLYDILASHLPTDKYQAAPWPEPLSVAIRRDPGRLRVLLAERPAEGGEANLERQTLAALHQVAEVLSAAGHDVDEGDLPLYKPGLTMTAQMAAGVMDELKLIDSVKQLESRTRQAIKVYRPAALLAGRAERRAASLAAHMFTIFDRYDLILTPTVAHPPLPVGQLDGKGLLGTIAISLDMTAYTSVWNVLGNPAAAVPAGFTANGLPLSVQFVAAPNNEPLLIQVAAQIEAALPWADKHPTL